MNDATAGLARKIGQGNRAKCVKRHCPSGGRYGTISYVFHWVFTDTRSYSERAR